MDELIRALSKLDQCAVDSAPRFPPMTSIVAAACQTIGRSDSVAHLLNRELARAASDPELFEPRWMGSEITVHEGKAIKVAISHLDTEPRLPFTVTSDLVIMLAHADAVVDVECFELPASVDLSVFDDAVEPSVRWRKALEAGQPVVLEAGQGVRFSVERSAALLTITTRTRLEQAWYFDPQTLRPLSIHASSVSAAIAQTLSDFLGTYGSASSIKPLAGLLEHPAHFIRFAAARDMLRISLDAGREAFKQLTSDPHPHVRRGAETTLSRLPPV